MCSSKLLVFYCKSGEILKLSSFLPEFALLQWYWLYGVFTTKNISLYAFCFGEEGKCDKIIDKNMLIPKILYLFCDCNSITKLPMRVNSICE